MKTLLTRSISGLLFVGLVILSLIADKSYALLLFSIVVGIGLFEFHRLFTTHQKQKNNWPITVISGLIFFLILSSPSLANHYEPLEDYSNYRVFWPLAIILFAFAHALIKNSIGLLLFFFGLIYICIPFFLASEIHFNDTAALPKILGVFLLVWTNDTFAYLSGNLIGKHKLYEKISPKKTWEGFVGGFIFTILMGYLLDTYLYEGMLYRAHFWLAAAVLISPASVIGDLFESGLKRKMNVKDSGNIMPGHGGILDRFDAILFALPVFYIWDLIISLY
ncbi:MAG: phosphatidate cytidylyltransferase [Crocinitomicaceae bacterium]|tara:strand:+ start:15012 stop:15845 length:834 start_codon:yes stop_codon:yes gene_type:complete